MSAGRPQTPTVAAPAAVFAALSDPTRRQLLEQIATEGPRNASHLAQSYALTRQAVAKHLAILADAGILQARRHGNEVRYALDTTALDEAAAWLSTVGHRWDRRLVALEKHLGRSTGNRPTGPD